MGLFDWKWFVYDLLHGHNFTWKSLILYWGEVNQKFLMVLCTKASLTSSDRNIDRRNFVLYFVIFKHSTQKRLGTKKKLRECKIITIIKLSVQKWKTNCECDSLENYSTSGVENKKNCTSHGLRGSKQVAVHQGLANSLFSSLALYN